MSASFVTTHRDVNYLGHQARKKVYFQGLAKAKSVNHFTDKFLPSTYVDSPILQRMLTACRDGTSGVCVIYCDPGRGKSAAAYFVLKNCAAGAMIGVPNNGVQKYWDAVGNNLGLPLEDDGKYSASWSKDLVDAVAEVSTDPPTQFQTALNNILCLPQPCPDDLPVFPTELEGASMEDRRVIIFDNFDLVDKEDVQFIRSFHEQAFGGHVLVFVLTQSKVVANQILRLNGWQRIRPLAGLCSPNHTVGDELPELGYFPDPTWNQLHWTATQLENLVRAHFASYSSKRLGNGRFALEAILENVDLEHETSPLAMIGRATQYVRAAGFTQS